MRIQKYCFGDVISSSSGMYVGEFLGICDIMNQGILGGPEFGEGHYGRVGNVECPKFSGPLNYGEGTLNALQSQDLSRLEVLETVTEAWEGQKTQNAGENIIMTQVEALLRTLHPDEEKREGSCRAVHKKCLRVLLAGLHTKGDKGLWKLICCCPGDAIDRQFSPSRDCILNRVFHHEWPGVAHSSRSGQLAVLAGVSQCQCSGANATISTLICRADDTIGSVSHFGPEWLFAKEIYGPSTAEMGKPDNEELRDGFNGGGGKSLSECEMGWNCHQNADCAPTGNASPAFGSISTFPNCRNSRPEMTPKWLQCRSGLALSQ